MKRKLAIAFAMMLSTQLVSPAIAQESLLQDVETPGTETLLPQRVDHVGVRATLLHWGMSRDDVDRIMGTPDQVDTFSSDGRDVHVLKYGAQPIATTVTITDDRLSAVSVDVAGAENSTLPRLSRMAWVGMSRTSVLRILGVPVDGCVRNGFGTTVEQMIIARPDMPDFSVFLIDGRVAAKSIGRSFPPDILSFALPLAPDPSDNEVDDVANPPKARPVRVGMEARDLPGLFGSPKHQVNYTFKGRPATYAIHDIGPGKFARFTFIDGVLTEFAEGGTAPLNQVLEGH
jgi:outer membrane protein assembly factor BamE (lipoprotein component of BamABCDE complex)